MKKLACNAFCHKIAHQKIAIEILNEPQKEKTCESSIWLKKNQNINILAIVLNTSSRRILVPQTTLSRHFISVKKASTKPLTQQTCVLKLFSSVVPEGILLTTQQIKDNSDILYHQHCDFEGSPRNGRQLHHCFGTRRLLSEVSWESRLYHIQNEKSENNCTLPAIFALFLLSVSLDLFKTQFQL